MFSPGQESLLVSRLQFHASLHVRPASVTTVEWVEVAGRLRSVLRVSPGEQSDAFSLSFEAASEALADLPRLHVEPDGSFVWRSESSEPLWQVDGNLYDREGRLLYVTLQGGCPENYFDKLLRCFGWPATTMMFQLVREATFLDEFEFRRHAQDMGARCVP